MINISTLIAFLPYLLCTGATAVIQRQLSQCSEYFTYVTKPGTTILGQIEISPPSINDEFYLKVALNTTTLLQTQIIRLDLARSIEESVRTVHQGRPLLYYINSPSHKSIPSISAIWFNNQLYCANTNANGNIEATIELGHILYPPLSYAPSSISLPWHRNSSNYRINNPNYDHITIDISTETTNKCGITDYYTDDTNLLISNGELSSPGQWPWLVAIYVLDINNLIKYFNCTGSILTTRHVITAAVCMFENYLTYIDPNRLYVSFGQLKLREWNEEDITNREVASYKIHPDYIKYANSNLAILILKIAIEYNPFIKPICLWSGSTSIQDLNGMTGYIVGWGRDLNRDFNYTGKLWMAKILLTNVEDCFENSRYFCVRSNMKICYADEGYGLVIFNTTTGRYQLRGVSHMCMSSVNSGTLYAYVNVAKYTSWIQQQITVKFFTVLLQR